MVFALKLFTKMPNEVRIAMILFSIKYSLRYGPNTLLRSLSPPILFGSGPEDFTWTPPPTSFGDEQAKAEARRMILQFKQEKESERQQLDEGEVKDVEMQGLAVETNPIQESLDTFPAPFN